MQTTRHVTLTENEHVLELTLPEPLSLPEIWSTLTGNGDRPTGIWLRNGTAQVVFGSDRRKSCDNCSGTCQHTKRIKPAEKVLAVRSQFQKSILGDS